MLKASIGSFGIKIGGLGLAYLTQIVVARMLGVGEYGKYTFVLSCMSVALALALLGWRTALVRYVSVYRSESNWPLLRGVLLSSVYIPLAFSCVIAATSALIAWLVWGDSSNGLFVIFCFAAFLLPLNAALSLLEAAVQGLKAVLAAQIPQAILRPVLLAGMMLMIGFVMGREVSASDAMVMNIICATIVAIFALIQLCYRLPKDIRNVGTQYQTKEWMLVALPLLLFSGFSLLMQQFDIIMLGIVVGTEASGIYAVSSKLATLTSIGLVAINGVVAPTIAQMYAQKKMKSLQSYAFKAAIGVFLLTIPIIIGCLLLGTLLLGFFGAEFIQGYDSLRILIIGQLINALIGPVGLFMTMTGGQTQASKIMGAGALLNIGLNLLLIPLYGIEGAAVATACSMVFWNILMLIAVRKKIGIDTTIFGWLKAQYE